MLALGGIYSFLLGHQGHAVPGHPGLLDAIGNDYMFIALFVLQVMTLAVLIKRWHDRNKSGFWLLINLLPVIGQVWMVIELGVLPGTPGTNRFGPSPKSATTAL